MTFNNQTAGDGTGEVDGFVITFDRPIDFTTLQNLTNAQLNQVFKVQYRSPTTPVGQAGTPVSIGSVQALNLFGPSGLPAIEATTLLVKFTQPQSAVGTYSYEIVAGTIRDAVRSNPIVQVVNPSQTFTETAQGNQIGLPIPTQGSGGTGSAQDITTSTLDVNDVPVGAVINTITVTLQINHTSDSDLIITLFAPDGTPVTLANQRGGTGDNFFTTTFTDAAATTDQVWHRAVQRLVPPRPSTQQHLEEPYRLRSLDAPDRGHPRRRRRHFAELVDGDSDRRRDVPADLAVGQPDGPERERHSG